LRRQRRSSHVLLAVGVAHATLRLIGNGRGNRLRVLQLVVKPGMSVTLRKARSADLGIIYDIRRDAILGIDSGDFAAGFSMFRNLDDPPVQALGCRRGGL
jgi:hypothetical protein